MVPNILVVEDNKKTSNNIKEILSLRPCHAFFLYDGQAAYEFIKQNKVDLMILDIMLPIMDGYELMTKIESFKIPIIILSAKREVEDRTKGIQLGGTIYLPKPFEMQELLAYVDRILSSFYKEIYQYNDIIVNLKEDTVFKNNKKITLTPKEYELLKYFLQYRGKTLLRNQILKDVWQYIYEGDSRTIDIHVNRLRKKLGLEDKIITVNKKGYRLD